MTELLYVRANFDGDPSVGVHESTTAHNVGMRKVWPDRLAEQGFVGLDGLEKDGAAIR